MCPYGSWPLTWQPFGLPDMHRSTAFIPSLGAHRRVLVPGGLFVLITLGAPPARQKLLAGTPDAPWDTQVLLLPKPAHYLASEASFTGRSVVNSTAHSRCGRHSLKGRGAGQGWPGWQAHTDVEKAPPEHVLQDVCSYSSVILDHL